ISQGLRERIVFEKDHYHVLNTDLKFTENEIIQLVENNPDKLSPNVIMRPLYQQKILPNIIYCGGSAEIAYWLQMKSNFKSFEINFPVLALRNFVGILNQNIVNKWKNLGFELKDIFHSTDELKKTWLSREQKEISLSDSKQKAQFLFTELKSISSEYDSSLNASVDAELQKLISAVDSIEKKINRSIKKQNEAHLNQIEKIKSKLFPDGNFQERKENFISLINNYGIKIIDEMIMDDQYEISGLYLKIL
ncbi:MAG: bacillithiol biosynthesis BshC, partial [Bacteroidota bacterium]